MKPLTLVITVMLCIPNASAQVRDPVGRRAAAPAGGDAPAIAAGWSALAGGQTEAAVKSADTILQRRPWDRAALVLKIAALSAAAPGRALDAYEQWLGAKRRDDAGLIEPIAIGVLQEIVKGRDASRRRDALKALAAARVAGAREALAALPPAPEDVFMADAQAARGGDAEAARRLAKAAADPTSATPALARALAEAGSSGEPGLLLLVKSSNLEIRAAAARALGAMKAESSRAALQQLRQDPDPIVRLSATVSLAQMGDQPALDAVDKMLLSGVPDVQIAAAEAWEGRDGPWVAIVRPLLENPDGLTRLEAARAIAPVDPEAARRVLGDALKDPNPAVRLEATAIVNRTLESKLEVADIAALRQRLRDADAAVRLSAASALLRLARA